MCYSLAAKKKSRRPKMKGISHKLAPKSSKSIDEETDRSTHSPVSCASMPSTMSSSSISTDASMGTTVSPFNLRSRVVSCCVISQTSKVLFSVFDQTPLGDALDRKIDALLRDWQQNPDLLFSVHPVDGSFLVW